MIHCHAYVDPTDILQEYVALDTLHDSSTSFDKPRCHPETRTAVLGALDRWAGDKGDQVKPIMWLHGPAGAGKSAIAQTLAERWGGVGEDSILLISAFIFSRQKPSCSDKLCFVATIAYQVRKNLPFTADAIDKAIMDDWALFKKSVSTQLFELLVRPLQALHQHNLNERREESWVVIIDGLDECSTMLGNQDYESQQREILHAIAVVITKYRLPLRFLIASRPEPQIRNVFNQAPLLHITASTLLADTPESRADIELFLRSRFSEIRSHHRYIQPNWPKEEEIAHILEKSSGHFIYASVVMRFVGHTLGDPITRLNTVLHLQASPNDLNENPFAELDNLYTYILLTIAPDSLPVVNCVFNLLLANERRSQHGHNFLLLGGRTENIVTPAAVEEHLFLHAGQLYHHLVNLNSVLMDISEDAPGLQSSIRFIHASFGDFLRDPVRSGQFCRSNALTEVLLHGFARVLVACSRKSKEFIVPIEDTMTFAAYELRNVPPSDELKEAIEILLTPNSQTELFVEYMSKKARLLPNFGMFWPFDCLLNFFIVLMGSLLLPDRSRFRKRCWNITIQPSLSSWEKENVGWDYKMFLQQTLTYLLVRYSDLLNHSQITSNQRCYKSNLRPSPAMLPSSFMQLYLDVSPILYLNVEYPPDIIR
jgi:tRNA U34 5-methylaminomethyl-2-thiouridine-forming methyltransferase MnmC